MKFNSKGLKEEQLVELYKNIVKPRLIEEKMLLLLRQGKISKWFSGIGQEAIAVGVTEALEKDEYILPMHRNLGVFTSRDIPMEKLFLQFQGKKEGFTKGRDRSFHFGTRVHHIVGMISHLGAQLAVANGIALANQIEKNGKVVVAFTGEGGTSEGDFHEALNVASVWQLPVIFLIENNGYGLSTPIKEQYRCKSLVDRGIGYGIKALKIDGNNILEVYNTLKKCKKEIQKSSKPILIEAMTFRMRGHEEASGTAYVPQNLMREWEEKDPVKNYEWFLLKEKILDENSIDKLKKEIKKEISSCWDKADKTPFEEPVEKEEMQDIYFPFDLKQVQESVGKKENKRFVDAISDGLDLAMEKYSNLILMGQDIADYGGVFKITKGFIEKFGKERVRNTPICESAIVGAGLGLSIRGYKAMVEMQFADFVSCGFNQIVNNLAKSHYRWEQNADVVVRMPTGAGVGAGPFHSQSNEAWFFNTPGLKIVYPSNPKDAKGLLLSSFEDPNPIMYFEHKVLYRSISGEVPLEYYTIPIGKGKKVTEGEEITVVTYGMGVHWLEKMINEGLNASVELIDLRTLLPWDKDIVKESVKKTGKVLVCHEDSITGGVGAEIAAWISENCFEYLDAPVMREGSLDTPVPFTKKLEDQYLPVSRIKEKVRELSEY